MDSLGAYTHTCASIRAWYGLQDMSSKEDTSTVLHENRANTTAKSPLTSHRHYLAVNIGCETSITYIQLYSCTYVHTYSTK